MRTPVLAPEETAPAPDTDRGFALLIVLWSLSLLALMLSLVTSTGRSDLATASALRDAAQSEAAADAAIHEAIWHLLDGADESWRLNGERRRLREAGITVDVGIIDDRGKIDINQAAGPLLEQLFTVLGVNHASARDLGTAIVEWHSQGPGADSDPTVAAPYRMLGLGYGPPGQEFQSLDELRMVRGMTPQIYAAAKPFLTLALEQAPWVASTGPEVLAAIARAKKLANLTLDNADPRGPQVFWVFARALGPGSARFERRAMIRFDGTLSGPAWKYRILALETGPPQPGE